MGSSFGRGFDPSRLKEPEPFRTPGIGDGIEESKRDDGNWYDPLPKVDKGILGTGMDSEDFVNMLTRAAALAQGEYGTAAQIGQLIGSPKREAREDARQLRIYDQKQQIEKKYQKPPSPHYFQDNAGNQMALDPVTGKVTPVFVDPSDRLFMANGGTVKVPNALRQSGQSGGLPPTYNSDEWEVVPGPQPSATPPSSQQAPATLTPEQWQAAVQALGPEKANAWLRRGNIRVGGR